MTTIDIPDEWIPNAANINALPDPLREYIHHLHTIADPQLMVQQNWELRDLVAALEAILQRERRETAKARRKARSARRRAWTAQPARRPQ
jgi:predicted GTPase